MKKFALVALLSSVTIAVAFMVALKLVPVELCSPEYYFPQD